MHNFSINQRLKNIKYIDSFDSFLINFFRIYMTEKIQKYQIIKFDYFDILIILILKKKISTDRPTDRQTFGPIEATCRRLKIYKKIGQNCKQSAFKLRAKRT